MAIGEAGSLFANTTTTGQAIPVNFEEPLIDPVIVLSGTNFGGNKFSFRVIDVQTNAAGEATGFTFTIDEWENHDGPHPRVENIHWLAIESGVHELPDGRIIEAGFSDADSDGESVSLNGGFTTTPTVLTTVASDNEPSNVDSDPFNITTSGFDLNVEEAESQDGIHGLETVGWIAIEPGGDGTSGTAQTVGGIDSAWTNNIDYGATYTDRVVVAETQTQNDPDTGNLEFRNIDANNVDIRFEEDTSVDGDTGHADETIALVTFENGLILCFTDGVLMNTPTGARPIESLTAGDLVLTQDNGAMPLLFASSSCVSGKGEQAPILIRAGALGPGRPDRDMRVSPQHRVLITGWAAQLYAGTEEVLVPAKALINDRTILRAPCAQVTYRHLLFKNHQIVTAHGLASESLYPDHLDHSVMSAASHHALLETVPGLRSQRGAAGPLVRPTLGVQMARVFAPSPLDA
ncbi:MAG: Hint domain-containing protein [Paracoccaceae bacterium]